MGSEGNPGARAREAVILPPAASCPNTANSHSSKPVNVSMVPAMLPLTPPLRSPPQLDVISRTHHAAM